MSSISEAVRPPARRTRPGAVVMVLGAVVALLAGLLVTTSGTARAAADTVRVMPLGDSITGNPGCWRQKLWAKLQTTGYQNVDFVGTLNNSTHCGVSYDGDNEGHGGFLATGIARDNQLPGWLSASIPDVVMMQLGTNDVWSHLSTETILGAYDTLVNQMRAQNPRMRVIVAQILPVDPTGCGDCVANTRALNAAIPAWAAARSTDRSPITYVDTFTGFDTATDTSDGVHPNDAGTVKLANSWYPALTSVVDSITEGTPAVTPTTTVVPTTAPPAPGSVGLHVADGKVVERDGTPFVARGVSHAHTWYTSRTTAAIPAIKALGANALRVVLSSGDQWTKNDVADVTGVVSQCKAAKLICMLEVHDTTGYGEQAAAVSLDKAVAYWISIRSALVGQEDYVQLNIGNEPYGNGANAADWAADTSAAIKKLRAGGFRNQIVVDAPNWGQDWASHMRNGAASVLAADPDANTVFSIHMYGVYDTAAEVKDYLAAFVSKNLPIVVGEFGFDHSDGNPDEDTIMSETTRLGLGYYGWSWSGNGGGVEYLDMVTNFDAAQLTTWGERIFNGTDGIKATAREATVFGGTPPTSAPPVTTTALPPVTTAVPAVTTPGTSGGCTATFTVQSAWPGGFVGSVTVSAATAVNGWSVVLDVPSGTTVSNVWNGNRTGNTVTNMTWNGKVSPGRTSGFGFQGTGSATGLTVAGCTAS